MPKTATKQRILYFNVCLTACMLFLVSWASVKGANPYVVIGADTIESVPNQQAGTDTAMVRAEVLTRLIASKAARGYDKQARLLVDNLFKRLDQFNLPTLRITRQTILLAFQSTDIGPRLGGVTREIWADWSGIAARKRVDVWTASPANAGLSPFRQLIVKLIQGRIGTLRDSEQHAIHNLLTRKEDPTVWYGSIDGVIAAINRDSFLWP